MLRTISPQFGRIQTQTPKFGMAKSPEAQNRTAQMKDSFQRKHEFYETLKDFKKVPFNESFWDYLLETAGRHPIMLIDAYVALEAANPEHVGDAQQKKDDLLAFLEETVYPVLNEKQTKAVYGYLAKHTVFFPNQHLKALTDTHFQATLEGFQNMTLPLRPVEL